MNVFEEWVQKQAQDHNHFCNNSANYVQLCIGMCCVCGRCLLSQVLREWSKYIPVAKERRKREKWKAHLRRKVVQWLPDFVGKTYEDSDDEDI